MATATLAVSLVVTATLGLVSSINAAGWSRALASGEIVGTYATPVYDKMPVPPGTPFGAANKLGADHASLFFAAKSYQARGPMYDAATDPWKRPAVTFPPVLIFLTARTTARFDFVTSALLSNFAQVGLLALVSAYFLERGPSSWALRPAAGAAGAFLLFCTPVGTTWFERAQTDLYCASAMLLLLKGMRDDTPIDFGLAGLVAGLKWSCLPFFVIVAPAYVLLSARDWRRRLGLVGLAVAVPLLLLVFFGAHAMSYLKLVQESELLLQPDGVSLQLYFPRLISKVVPFALPLTLVGLAWSARARARAMDGLAEVAFLAAAGMATASFGTIAYEYRFVTLLFLLPLLADGRSVLLGTGRMARLGIGRVAGTASLIYAFRVQTIPAATAWMDWHRAVVPLYAGVAVILISARFKKVDNAPFENPQRDEGDWS